MKKPKSNFAKNKETDNKQKKISFQKKDAKENQSKDIKENQSSLNKKRDPEKKTTIKEELKKLKKKSQKKNTPTENPKNLDIPETISNVIIRKIISYVITKNRTKEIYNKLPLKCFNYTKKLLNPFLNTEFLLYDNGIDDLNKKNNFFYYKHSLPKNINTWVNFTEPLPSEKDRYAYSNTKIIEIIPQTPKTPNKTFYSESNKNKERRRSSYLVGVKPVSENPELGMRSMKSLTMIKNIIDKKNELIKKKINFYKNNQNKNEEEIYVKERKGPTPEEIENQKIIDSSFYDLSKDKYENIYIINNNSDENNILRKKHEIFLHKREEQKILDNIKAKQEHIKKFQQKQTKLFDNSKYTFDPNGNIVKVQKTSVEKLSQDFSVAKMVDIKNKNEQRRKSIKNDLTYKRLISKNFKNNLKIKNSRKKSLIKDEQIEKQNRAIKEKNKLIIKYFRNDILPKILEKVKTNSNNENRQTKFSNLSDTNSNLNKQEKKIENENEIKNMGIKQSFREFFGGFLEKYVYKHKIEHNPLDKINYIDIDKREIEINKKSVILPCGSNFKKIKPETGVIIINDENKKNKEIKEGGMEYIKKYNRISFHEFSKLIYENSQLNSKNSSFNNLDSDKKMEPEYNGYKQEFNENNPLIENALPINDKKRLLSSNISEKENDFYKNRIMSSVDSIQLSEKFKNGNLYSVFYEPKNENKIEEKKVISAKKIDNNKNLLPIIKLRNKIIENRSQSVIKYNEKYGRKIINKFNFKILKDKDWGIDIKESQNKPKNQIIIKKSSILNKPFKYKFNSNSNENNSNIIDNMYNIRSRKLHNMIRSSSANNIY